MKTYHYGGCRIPIQMNYLSIYLSIYEYNYTDTIKLGVLIYRVITHRLKRKGIGNEHFCVKHSAL